MPLPIKRAMDIHARVVVGIRFVMTHRAREQLSPFHLEAFAAKVREPLPPGAASGAILAGAMRIYLDGHCAGCRIRLVFGIAIDLSPQLIGLSTIHAP